MVKIIILNLYQVTYCIVSMIALIVYIAFLPCFAKFDEWDERIDAMFIKLVDKMPIKEDV